MVILNVQSGQTVLVKNQKPVGRANTNLKTGHISTLGGTEGGRGLVGDGADKGGLYSKWFILQ